MPSLPRSSVQGIPQAYRSYVNEKWTSQFITPGKTSKIIDFEDWAVPYTHASLMHFEATGNRPEIDQYTSLGIHHLYHRVRVEQQQHSENRSNVLNLKILSDNPHHDDDSASNGQDNVWRPLDTQISSEMLLRRYEALVKATISTKETQEYGCHRTFKDLVLRFLDIDPDQDIIQGQQLMSLWTSKQNFIDELQNQMRYHDLLITERSNEDSDQERLQRYDNLKQIRHSLDSAYNSVYNVLRFQDLTDETSRYSLGDPMSSMTSVILDEKTNAPRKWKDQQHVLRFVLQYCLVNRISKDAFGDGFYKEVKTRSGHGSHYWNREGDIGQLLWKVAQPKESYRGLWYCMTSGRPMHRFIEEYLRHTLDNEIRILIKDRRTWTFEEGAWIGTTLEFFPWGHPKLTDDIVACKYFPETFEVDKINQILRDLKPTNGGTTSSASNKATTSGGETKNETKDAAPTSMDTSTDESKTASSSAKQQQKRKKPEQQPLHQLEERAEESSDDDDDDDDDTSSNKDDKYQRRYAWKNIPTEEVDNILMYQNIPAEVINYWYIFAGRMGWKIGQMDNWQVQLFLKGVAGTGKSSLLQMVIYLWDPVDIGFLSNTVEPNFPIESLINCFAYFMLDIGSKFRLDQTLWQSMVSGEGTAINRKGRVRISIIFDKPGMGAGNQYPPYTDNAGSLSRRLPTIEFLRNVMDAVCKPDILDDYRKRISVNVVKDSCAYDESARVIGFKPFWLHCPKYFREVRKRVRRDTNQLEAFLDSDTIIHGKGYYIPYRTIKQAFETYVLSHSGLFNTKRQEYDDNAYIGVFNHRSLRLVRKENVPWPPNNTHMWNRGRSDLFVEGCDLSIHHRVDSSEGQRNIQQHQKRQEDAGNILKRHKERGKELHNASLDASVNARFSKQTTTSTSDTSLHHNNNYNPYSSKVTTGNGFRMNNVAVV